MNWKKYINRFKSRDLSENGLPTSILLIIGIIVVSIIVDLFIQKSLLLVPLISSIIISAIITKWGIIKLKKINCRQVVRKEGPSGHFQKSGTPSMGGIFIVPISLILTNLFALSNNTFSKQLVALSFLSLAYMLIGLIDDWQSITLKRNKGLSVKSKVILQTIVGIIFLVLIYSQDLNNTDILIFGNNTINLGLLFWPIALFILLAESNATNLTDGLDGLASGCGAIVFTGLAIELIIRGNNENYAIASFCITMAGAWLGFLIFNRKPAKVFMGDTGSLAMGASLAGVALLTNTLWSLLIMGVIFLAESVSVIIQVGVFKTTKKIIGKGYRVFNMAPLHHHFELEGTKETIIVQNFWLITICFVCMAIMLR
ncbi:MULTISPECIES: phospho-N-acetylmuramoyl-pentapeptide-transferase [Prochlorococcus]|uniref:Phospho-N-acetylmuramoyl-pentapeptide-transferase n=1 Tax=Prochlorococcus marinus (strain SARG / CCMP1375 / SS120) TaxID=167539 RepID=MRAY_PROMA|nr:MULTISPECIES: phospho-N-acetylmuramoyl-pentapeptide-transferase [Prochlorococcus]Q7V9F5.1 RecName: Full=Phospho-N-acetylmuramoyl-pentapeptide-transferase; AltName: Full=UDP-MurNAc-pentapeptide phosphotransferase [Prochlorococcus marinus subsp. marinus str. CCMP1375]AAQ00922.1 UDP-N-acetylmuramyl pentapeptide phosphotransferase/UDP-N-acetylglucosamine-1-phosphate transferase [Prochlorococcus marinus subsp. marinus str. CCMP1375]KGG10465.1 Phospho-N-acetylmuramoyl-pentapeptide- transferase [Pro